MANNKRFDYFSYPPQRVRLKHFLTYNNFKRMFSKISYFITLALSPYESEIETPVEITSTNPVGKLCKDHLAICERIYEETVERNDHLIKKATSMLSSIAILVPLVVSAVVYLATTANLDIWCYRFTVFIAMFSIIFLFLGFFSAFRTLFVRQYASIYLHHIIDEKQNKIKDHSDDLYSRNLLWSASKNTAMNDHKADFIRASQLFIAISVFLLILSTAPLFYTLSPKTRVQRIAGDVNISSKGLEKSLTYIARDIHNISQKIDNSVDLKEQLEALQRKVQGIEKGSHINKSTEK